MNIEIIVRNKIARLADKRAVAVCGNSDYTITFDFDEEWNAYETKTARFKWNKSFVDVSFTGKECVMPVINDAYQVEIGVYAGELSSTTSALLPMKKSILCDTDNDIFESVSGYINQLKEFTNKLVQNESTEIKVSDWNGVTKIKPYLFIDCSTLTSVEFPESTKIIGEYAFEYCRNLKSVKFSSGVKNIGEFAFGFCSSLTSIKLIASYSSIYQQAFWGCAGLSRVDMNNGSIMSSAFGGANIETLIIRSNITIVNLYSTFANVFEDSCPIAKGTGYIYVPKTMIEKYKSNSNWASVSTQFRAIEDYPEICG